MRNPGDAYIPIPIEHWPWLTRRLTGYSIDMDGPGREETGAALY